MTRSLMGLDESDPELLIVSFEQFGYHTDTFEYCRHLRARYRISYLCPDQGLPRCELAGVEVLYVARPPLGKAELGLLRDAGRVISRLRPDVVFLRRTKFSFLLRLRHPRTPMIFDVRTGSIDSDPRRRRFENAILRWNARCFRHITVISSGLARQLRLPRRSRVLPLAANSAPASGHASRDELRLVYVGTFTNRHLERTVEGLARFLSAGGAGLPVRYTIVGFGSERELAAIQAAVRDGRLEDVVELRTRVGHDAVASLLAEHNVGVAFTPREPWFEHQPSTKIFEYLHVGLLCIASDTAANREVISEHNGVLVDDTAESFASGLERARGMLRAWRPEVIADGIRVHTWEAVVRDVLEPLLAEVRR